MVRGEANEEDEDGAADQLFDPDLLIWLCPSTPTHSAKDTQVADLDRGITVINYTSTRSPV